MWLIFLDSETTGLNPEKHRLLEIAFKVIDARTGKALLSYESTISQPTDVWANADPRSLGINGFNWEELLSGKSEATVSSEILNDLNRLGLGEHPGVFVCQNPSFDRVFFNQLIDVDLQEHYRWPYHWLDLASMYWMARLLNKREEAVAFQEKELSKNAIASYYGLPPEPLPHRAMNGVSHLIACYEAVSESLIAE